MSDPSTSAQDEEMPGEVVAARRSGISWAWLFPLLALAATGWLFWSNWKAKGPEIQITFATAPGIDPGKTALLYRGVKAGTVSKVNLDHELGKVIVTVQLKSFAAHLARKGTEFWIEEPVISLREIAGLESIIQGNSIQARTHPGGEACVSFEALSEAPLTPLDASDLTIKLRAGSIPFLGRGTPVFHRGVSVGWVRDKTFDKEGNPEVEVIIDEKHVDRVNANSRFWAMPATALSASPGSVSLAIPALQGLLDGSISFDHFGPAGSAVSNDAVFELLPDEFAARSEGPAILVSFDDVSGVKPGETRVTCHGRPVGLVRNIRSRLAEARAELEIRLSADFAPLATADSTFTIVRPNISPEGLKGLDTLVTGPHIAFEPGTAKEPGNRFTGRDQPQIDWEVADAVKNGKQIVLWANELPPIHTGAPIYHHGMIAGRVIEQRRGAEGRPEIVALIDEQFHNDLHVNTRFWRVPAALLNVGPGVVGVQIPGLSALWQGGLAFDVFGNPGPAVTDNVSYQIHVSETSASAVSDPIRIEFEDGQGLLAGKTELRYVGIPVGIVESVRVKERRVEATARFLPGYDFLRRGGAEFAVVRPEIDLKGVKGIDTLIGGVYINCAPGGGEFVEYFNAVPQEAPALLNEPGFEIVLESPSTRIDAGAPISYNDTPVGEVIAKKLSRDGKRIFLTARIRDEHSNLVKSNSVFWEEATVEAKVGFFKVEIDTPSVTAPAGRVAFHTPDGGARAVKERTTFALQPKQPEIQAEAPKAKIPFLKKRQ